ncbi:MAG: Transferrin receptor domain protein dimerization region [Gemmatimonadetes bacterium]|nr:Transferrin receptor domain protein dimerization region [Gemmatimonadota bacterium]
MRPFAFVPLLALGTLALTPIAVDPPQLRGFTAASSRVQREWEDKFKAIPEPARMRESMRRLAARPHHVGSVYGKDNAEWLRDQFRSYGWQAEIERFDVLFPTPKERVVELVAPTHFRASLQEPTLKEDATSGQRDEQLPTYNAYSGDGDVTAPLVYVNYGIPADYDELARHGVSVKGAIVIARYGQSWRGIKPKLAAEHGAVGCIIYSDPRDDGYQTGEAYPNGPMRPATGVQRGSVADMPTYPGDPLTPGVGATPGAKRLSLAEATTITKVPVLPISWSDAEPLLRALGGEIVPAAWRGGLGIGYHFGPGAAKVHLVVKSNWQQAPLYDVIAKLPGSDQADQWVIRGNHHDAWVNGAEDPISGLVPELEEARAMGELWKQGWRPRRTIIYAAWDGEEPGLLGSTEWVETHEAELREHAAAYINTDGNDRGFLGAQGSHALENFVTAAAQDVTDPETKMDVAKRLRLATIAGGTAEARTRADLRLDALGSGSDFTPFLQHAGVPTLNVGFAGEGDQGIYHSIYDSFHWYTTYSDTSFVYGKALSQVVGLMVMRLADADLLPFTFGNLAETAGDYAKELQSLRDRRAGEITERNTQIDEGAYAAASDPRQPTQAPPRLAAAPQLNFAPLLNAVEALKAAASRYDAAAAGATAGAGGVTLASQGNAAAQLRAANVKLLQSERAMLSPDGLPGRPWFRHMLYAPGYYTGYGVKTMPAVREAIEQGKWAEAEREIVRVADALKREATLLDEATAALRP